MIVVGGGGTGGAPSYYGSWALTAPHQQTGAEKPFKLSTVAEMIPTNGVSYDNATGLFTVLNEGIYMVDSVLFLEGIVRHSPELWLKKNGAIFYRVMSTILGANNAPTGHSLTLHLALAANDTIEIEVDSSVTEMYPEKGTIFNIHSI